MKVAHKRELKKFYDALKKAIPDVKSSLIERLLQSRASKTKPIYESISYPIDSIELAQDLEEKGYIVKHHQKLYEYSITAYGIWEYEKSIEKTNIKNVMSILQNKYFTADTKPIGDLDRIILSSLLFSRIFSSDNEINLDRANTDYNSKWHEINIDIMNVLYETKIISKKNHTFVKHTDKSYLYVRQNNLSSQTNAIYVRGSGTHHLNIIKTNGEVDIRKLSILYTFIFGDNCDESQYQTIFNYIKRFAKKNRFKLDSNKLFMDRDTTNVLLDVFRRKYLLHDEI